MTKDVIYIRENDSFSKVAEKLANSSIRHLPVINEKGEVVGLFTQRDLYRIVSPQRNEYGEWIYDLDKLDDIILKHVMVKDPHVLQPENTVGEAVVLMFSFKYGCVPITDGKRLLCGIITQYDILKALRP